MTYCGLMRDRNPTLQRATDLILAIRYVAMEMSGWRGHSQRAHSYRESTASHL